MGLNYASSGFYSPMYSGFHGNTFPQQHMLPVAPMAPEMKRRRYEDQSTNEGSAKITEITEEPINCDVKNGLVVENRKEDKHQQISAINGGKKPADIFRPYQDIHGKNL